MVIVAIPPADIYSQLSIVFIIIGSNCANTITTEIIAIIAMTVEVTWIVQTVSTIQLEMEDEDVVRYVLERDKMQHYGELIC